MTIPEATELAKAVPIELAADLFCAAMGTSVKELTARHIGLGTRRKFRTGGNLPRLRAAVWWHMRQVRLGSGPKWSYPDIAAVFDTSWSTVIEGVNRHEAAMGAAEVEAA